MESVRSELSWTAKDYLDAGRDVPGILLQNPLQCEGELMADWEVHDYITDSVATLSILADKHSDSFGRVFAHFVADLDFLLKIGRIKEDDYNELIDENSYGF